MNFWKRFLPEEAAPNDRQYACGDRIIHGFLKRPWRWLETLMIGLVCNCCFLLKGVDMKVKTRLFLSLFLLIFVQMFIISIGMANDRLRGGRLMISASPVTPAEAAKILSKRLIMTLYQPEESNPPEITALARSLKNDVDLIYAFVHDNIQLEIGYGATRSPLGTMLDKRGNAFDQAALMVTLLSRAGITAGYVHGTVRLKAGQVESRLGLPPNADIVNRVLASAGVPVETSPASGSSLTHLDMDHVWVKVDLDGEKYVFDPSLKEYTIQQPLDLQGIMGYSRPEFLGWTFSGAEIHLVHDDVADDHSRVQNLNRGNLRSELADYAARLVKHIRANNPGAKIKDVIGGKKIIPADGPVRVNALPYELAGAEDWPGDIPYIYQTLVRVAHAGFSILFRSSDIYGRNLVITPDKVKINLMLDDRLIATGGPGKKGSAYLVIDIDHPYAAENGRYGDQNRTFKGVWPGFAFITHSWGSMSRELAERSRLNLARLMDGGARNDSSETRAAVLAVLARNYQAMDSRFNSVTKSLLGIEMKNQHTVGVVCLRMVGFESSTYWI